MPRAERQCCHNSTGALRPRQLVLDERIHARLGHNILGVEHRRVAKRLLRCERDVSDVSANERYAPQEWVGPRAHVHQVLGELYTTGLTSMPMQLAPDYSAT